MYRASFFPSLIAGYFCSCLLHTFNSTSKTRHTFYFGVRVNVRPRQSPSNVFDHQEEAPFKSKIIDPQLTRFPKVFIKFCTELWQRGRRWNEENCEACKVILRRPSLAALVRKRIGREECLIYTNGTTTGESQSMRGKPSFTQLNLNVLIIIIFGEQQAKLDKP